MKISTKFLSIGLISYSLIITMISIAKAKDYLSISTGCYDVIDDEKAADFRIEYRPDTPVLLDLLHPWAGIELTSDGSVWGGGGLLYNWEFTPNWYITPNFGAGVYMKGSSNLDLGHTIEFRSQLEITHKFESEQKLGIAFGHISNASLDNDNPGTEILNIYWHIPY